MGKQKTVIMEGDIIKKPATAETQKGRKGVKKEKKEEPPFVSAKALADKKASVGRKVAEEKKKKEKPAEGKKRKKVVPKIRKRSKNYKQAQKFIEKDKIYSIDEALDLLKKLPKGNFDPTVETHIKLGVDLSQPDQKIRTQITFPNDIGKTKKILVFASDVKEKEAKKAGADFVGGEELVKKIEKGFSDFDIVISTPEMMSKVGRLGKYLGQKGLMPNPKSQTVTSEVGKLITDIKKGKTEIKSDDYGIVHQVIGKLSQDDEKLKGNFKTLMENIIVSKPTKVKRDYIKSITLCSTFSPGIKIHWP